MDSNLKDVLMAPAILGSLGGAVYLFTKTVTDYILKKKMIEKGFVNEEAQGIFRQQQTADSRYPSLKWGLLILTAGLALILMEYIPASPDSPLPYGLFAVFVSAGFLTYYFLIRKDTFRNQ